MRGPIFRTKLLGRLADFDASPLVQWLKRPPIPDPIDQRSAPVLQVIILCLGPMLAVLNALFLWDKGWALLLRLDYLFGTLSNGMIALASILAFLMIRRGRLRAGSRLFIVVSLTATLVAYTTNPIRIIWTDPTPPLLLVISALSGGRRPLWRTFGSLAAICTIAAMLETMAVRDGARAFNIASTAGAAACVLLLITLAVDQTVAALRDSLDQSEDQRYRLQLLNDTLLHVMAQREDVAEQLLHAQKMEAMGRMASGALHDLDNTFNVVLGYARRREHLADRGIAPLIDALAGVEIATLRGVQTTRRLLDFGRRDPGKPRIVDLNALIRTSLPLVRQLLGSGVAIEHQDPLAYRAAYIDPHHLEIIILNIAANARDAMASGGHFILCARSSDHGVTLACSDTGSGIDHDLLERMFDPFVTTKPPGHGTGLGLSVVRDLVASYGGRVDAANTGTGACITVALPSVGASGECEPRAVRSERSL